MKKGKIIVITLLIIFIYYIGLHSTPKLSMRSYLLSRGYFKAAITADIENDIMHKDIETDKVQYLQLKENFYDKETGNTLLSFKVEKKVFIYFTTYYGGA